MSARETTGPTEVGTVVRVHDYEWVLGAPFEDKRPWRLTGTGGWYSWAEVCAVGDPIDLGLPHGHPNHECYCADVEYVTDDGIVS